MQLMSEYTRSSFQRARPLNAAYFPNRYS
jgi:hypothetical protein